MNNIIYYVLLAPFVLWLLSLLGAFAIVAIAHIQHRYFNKGAQNSKHERPVEASTAKSEGVDIIEAVSPNVTVAQVVAEVKAEKPAIEQEQQSEKSKESLKERIELLESQIVEGIVKLQAEDPELFVYVLCFVFKLDLKKSKDASLGRELVVSIYKSLGLDTQVREFGCTVVPQHPNVQQMLHAVLSAAYGMIKHSKENFQVVFDYKSMLQSKLRSLSSTDEYGDPDYSKWASFSSKFSVEKLKGFFDLKIYMEITASSWEREKVLRSGLADMYGHYVREMLTLLIKFDADEDILSLSGQEYELLLKQKIEERFDDSYVEMTPVTGDHGGDLIVDIKSTRFVLQAKYYKSNVGNDAVQEAYSGKGYYRADYAMVVCDSGYTKHAIELAEQLDVMLCTTSDYLSKIEMILGE